ncbi:hypothetical protein HOG21_05690 [bacterium]|nr:hypothetical protein [bacterium]
MIKIDIISSINVNAETAPLLPFRYFPLVWENIMLFFFILIIIQSYQTVCVIFKIAQIIEYANHKTNNHANHIATGSINFVRLFKEYSTSLLYCFASFAHKISNDAVFSHTDNICK